MKKLIKALFTAITITAASASSALADNTKHTCGTPSLDIVETAASNKSFSTLVAAVKAAGLADALKGEGPLTVFAPTDEAFAKLPAGTLESLLKPENKHKLVEILSYHVVSGKVPAEKAVTLSEAISLNHKKIMLKVADGHLILNDSSKVVKSDIMTKNGIIHVIDTVILPHEG